MTIAAYSITITLKKAAPCGFFRQLRLEAANCPLAGGWLTLILGGAVRIWARKRISGTETPGGMTGL